VGLPQGRDPLFDSGLTSTALPCLAARSIVEVASKASAA
jgi:hypothetical protein